MSDHLHVTEQPESPRRANRRIAVAAILGSIFLTSRRGSVAAESAGGTGGTGGAAGSDGGSGSAGGAGGSATAGASDDGRTRKRKRNRHRRG